jgi:SAM-dependent methyltransferase
MEKRTDCRICGRREYAITCTKSGARYVTCAGCGVIRQFPYPTGQETKLYYDEYHRIKARENPLYLSDANWPEYKRIKNLTFNDLDFLPVKLSGTRVLDVGCATGQFVQYAASFGADSYGIDVSKNLIDAARAKGHNCEIRGLFNVHERFDFIAMNHVIEHVNDPLAYLAHIHGILAADGFLLLETPCTGAVSESFGENWRFFIPTEHIHLFSQESLFKVLARSGFQPRSWVRFGSGHTAGTVPDAQKKAADAEAKKTGTGDIIAVLCTKG